MTLRIRVNAPVTLSFVGLCLVATLLGVLSKGKLTELLFMCYRSSFRDVLAYVRVFTHVLGHGGWAHFIGNMLYILLLGPLLEEKYGGKRLVWVILLTALITGLANLLIFPKLAVCGASGVVFAFIMLSSLTGFHAGEIPVTFLLVAVCYLGQQVVQGLFTADNISQFSHIIGGLVGAAIGFYAKKR